MTAPSPEARPSPPRVEVLAALGLAVLVRAPFWLEAWRTPLDGDSAIVGLMARHPFAATTLWGQPYGSPLEAWLAAPLVALFGPTEGVIRIFYFALGLALVPLAYFLGRALDARTAFPAALLVACPPAYILLMASMPPPLYPATLLLGGLVLLRALALARRAETGAACDAPALGWGVLSGVALWNHLASAAVLLAAGLHLARRLPRRALALAILGVLAGSAPLWLYLPHNHQVLGVVRPATTWTRAERHFGALLANLHEPLGGLVGAHSPLVPDEPDQVPAPAPVGWLLPVAYGVALASALKGLRDNAPARLLAGSATATVLLFLLPLRSKVYTIRFLTPASLPLLVLVAWALSSPRARRFGIAAFAALHLAGAAPILLAWHGQARDEAPFLVPDLRPVGRLLEEEGVRHAFASYYPAYNLTFASGERLLVTQPWNERFPGYPLPYFDRVDGAPDAAWILTPHVPSDLPSPKEFEKALAGAGTTYRRTEVGAAVVYRAFEPPLPAGSIGRLLPFHESRHGAASSSPD
jgi:hypothetical protein